jgi:poly(hydroxyalkanoate) granule-associated protein
MNEAQTIESGLEKLKSAGRSLWLASLGAVAEVEENGRDLFDHLVERGRPFEKKQLQAFEKAGEKTQETVRELGTLVQDTVEFETKGVLQKLGLLTRDDVKILSARLDTLSRKLDELAAPAPLILTPEELAAPTASMTALAPTAPTAPKTPKTRRPRQTTKAK